MVTELTNPWTVDCDTLLLRRELKQSDIRIKCDNKNQASVLYFQYKGIFSQCKFGERKRNIKYFTTNANPSSMNNFGPSMSTSGSVDRL